MNHIATRLVAAFFTFLIGIASVTVLNPLRFNAATNSQARQEILQVERQYIQAHLKRDTATLDSILADEFTIRSLWGRGTDKARRLALLENSRFAFEAINTDDVEVKVNGDSAEVTGEAFVQCRYEDEEFVSPTYKFTRHYEKRRGQWQIVSVRVWR